MIYQLFLFSLCLFIISSNSSAQGNNPSRALLDKIVLEIKQFNVCEDALVGPGNDSSLQFKRFKMLEQIANVWQLEEILETESNGVLKAYAYAAFKNKKASLSQNIYVSLFQDNSMFIYQSGCNTKQLSIASFVKQYNILGKRLLH